MNDTPDVQWTVYGLVDPRNEEVFYIGSSMRVKRRVLQHQSDYASPAIFRMKELKAVGLKAIVKQYGTYKTKAEAWAHEYELIGSTPTVLNKQKELKCKWGCGCAKHDRTPFLGNPNWEQEFSTKERRREAVKRVEISTT